jgi:hypothetical protein
MRLPHPSPVLGDNAGDPRSFNLTPAIVSGGIGDPDGHHASVWETGIRPPRLNRSVVIESNLAGPDGKPAGHELRKDPVD